MNLIIALLFLFIVVISFCLGYMYKASENPPVYNKPIYDRPKKTKSVVTYRPTDRFIDGGGAWGNSVMGGQTKSVTNLLDPLPEKKEKRGILKDVWSYLRSV